MFFLCWDQCDGYCTDTVRVTTCISLHVHATFTEKKLNNITNDQLMLSAGA